jgi:ankyrin repeat protein
MRNGWRVFFSVAAIALVALVFFVVRSNLRSGAFLTAMQKKDVTAARRLLAQEPGLVSTLVMPQGSRSTTSQTRWRGRTVLHYLVSDLAGGSTEMAQALLDAGADFNARLDGDTLLHLAAATGDLPMMTWLLDHGAGVNARNGCEHPVEAICGSGKFAEWQPFDRRREGGTVCTGCDREGQTPLHAAQRSSRAYEGSTLLLARGAEILAVDGAGRTVLHVAGQDGKMSQDSRVLCAYGADPSVRDRAGKTAADLARESSAANTVDRYSATGPSELPGWLAPGGGCAQLAARARPGTPVPVEDGDAAWRAYVCTRDAQYCQK